MTISCDGKVLTYSLNTWDACTTWLSYWTALILQWLEKLSCHRLREGKMTRKGEKRVSSTPAQNQSEVEGWTGQSPSAESWLVSQQQGSISERHRQAQMRRGHKVSIIAHNMRIGSNISWIKTHLKLDLLQCFSRSYQAYLQTQNPEGEELICLKCMDTQPLGVWWSRV